MVAKRPQKYELTLFDLKPLHVMHQRGGIAQKRGCSLEDHLIDLERLTPEFSSRLLDELNSYRERLWHVYCWFFVTLLTISGYSNPSADFFTHAKHFSACALKSGPKSC